MPINIAPPVDWAEPGALAYVDRLPRQVVAFGAPETTDRWEIASHAHRKAELLYSVRGMVYCEVEGGVWLVPSRGALWIPAGVAHRASGSRRTECGCLFIDEDAVPSFPRHCVTLSVSPLLGELLPTAARFPALYGTGGPQGRLIAILLDELAAAPAEEFHWPLPQDHRLRGLARLMLAEPGHKLTLEACADACGMSERALTRGLRREIGMSLGQWHRRLHIILSLQRLARGESVQSIALDLGYRTAGNFITMFRKAVGKPPKRYLLDRGRNVAE